MVAGLAFVHALVCEQAGLVGGAGLAWPCGVAAARADGDVDAVDAVGRGDLLLHALLHALGRLVVQAAGDDEGELVAADAEGEVFGAHAAAQALRDLPEQLVAHVVAVGVVDRLELVEVEVEEGEGDALALLDVQDVGEVALVEQPREVVGVGGALELLAKADVLDDE